MGTSPFNRGGFGVVGGDAEKHGKELDGVGFSWDKWEGVAMQINPHDNYEIIFNKDQEKRSDGLIPPLSSIVLGMTVGGSHTTVWFRQVTACVRSLYPEFATEAGFLDKAKLTTGPGKEDFKQGLEEGLEYTFLHYQTEQAWPGLMEFIQTALNVQAQGGRSEMEGITKMWGQAVALGVGGCDWSRIEADAAKTLSPWTKYSPAMTAYLKSHSGTLLSEMPKFLRAFDRADKVPYLGGSSITKPLN